MPYKMKNKFTAVIVVLLLAVMVIPITPDCSFAQTKEYKWRMPSFLPRGTSAEKVREQWVKDLEVASGGRIKIAYYGAGEILPPLQMWDAIINGNIDIAFSYGAYWRGKSSLSMFSEGFPFTVYDVGEVNALLYEYGIEDIIRKGYAKGGVHLLRVLPCFNNTMIDTFDFKSFEDFKKHKIRAGGPPAEMLKAMDIPTVYVPTPDIYGALQRGVIDATIGGPISYFYDLGFHEVAKYVLIPGTGTEADEIIMNPKTWNSMPNDLKMLLYHSAADLSQRLAGSYFGRDAESLNVMQTKHGVKKVNISESECKKMTKYTIKSIENIISTGKDPDFIEATNKLKKFLKANGRID
jgi:TRAP-type mannitol/chloroaromatic compound transport system substrate-binding protein